MQIPSEDLTKKNALVTGVDEVGRGALAGPIVAAAVMFKYVAESPIKGLKDSKKFSSRQAREEVHERLMSATGADGMLLIVDYVIEAAKAGEIDKIGIQTANAKIFSAAVNGLIRPADQLYVDGVNAVEGFPLEKQIVEAKADDRYWFVSAASIIAKVYRDRLMVQIAKEYPQYGFERNSGYGTAEHIAAIKKHGPTPHHRTSFIKNFI